MKLGRRRRWSSMRSWTAAMQPLRAPAVSKVAEAAAGSTSAKASIASLCGPLGPAGPWATLSYRYLKDGEATFLASAARPWSSSPRVALINWVWSSIPGVAASEPYPR